MFNSSEAWSLKLTAIAALIPESAALGLLSGRGAIQQVNSEACETAESSK
ncbi:hypothetical protein PN498_23885 [Oscillatoria sp. CS-180]|nr:hypothetical protein [Oscillatoria sp. CS-180]MDB9529055.1 hypothetical protein [Oscillatoria sp. CS-180]